MLSFHRQMVARQVAFGFPLSSYPFCLFYLHVVTPSDYSRSAPTLSGETLAAKLVSRTLIGVQVGKQFPTLRFHNPCPMTAITAILQTLNSSVTMYASDAETPAPKDCHTGCSQELQPSNSASSTERPTVIFSPSMVLTNRSNAWARPTSLPGVSGGQPYTPRLSAHPTPRYESGYRRQIPRRIRGQLQVNQGGMNPAVAQPPADVVQRDSVEQHMPGKLCLSVWVPTLRPWGSWPASVARRTACCTHLQTVTRDTSINLPCPTVPKLVAAVRAVCSSGWTGTTRSFRPLPCRTTSVGRSESKCKKLSQNTYPVLLSQYGRELR